MNKYILYVKTSCSYCQQAEDLLREQDNEILIVPFDDSPVILEHMKWVYEHSTVPIIFHVTDSGIKLVGGYTELVAYLDGRK
tara:strand:- start:1390 stop:1635 length:246 start_codon:yes stop_codon:yes gene_type:complete